MLIDGLWMLFGGAFVGGMATRGVMRSVRGATIREYSDILHYTFIDIESEREFVSMVRDYKQKDTIYNILEEYKANGGAFSRYHYFRDLWDWVGNERKPFITYDDQQNVINLLMHTKNKMSNYWGIEEYNWVRTRFDRIGKAPMYIPVQYYPTVLRDMILDHPDPKYARENPVWAISDEHIFILQEDVDEAFAILEGKQKKRPIPTNKDWLNELAKKDWV